MNISPKFRIQPKMCSAVLKKQFHFHIENIYHKRSNRQNSSKKLESFEKRTYKSETFNLTEIVYRQFKSNGSLTCVRSILTDETVLML